MKLFKFATQFATVCVAAVSLNATSVYAMSLTSAAQPAELPPTNFTDPVYVDSRGCMYLRAGDAGAPSWVARVSRTGDVICGVPPSLNAVQSPTSAEISSGQVTRTVRVNCPASSGVSQASLGNGQVVPVRCNPQQTSSETYYVDHDNGERTRVVASPAGQVALVYPDAAMTFNTHNIVASDVTFGTSAPALGSDVEIKGYLEGYPVVARKDIDKLPAQTRVAPRTYPAANVKVVVPSGYRRVWTDDRLNPNRGVQTVEGMRQTRMIWTDTVPRRLVVVTTDE